ncbi:hypothetical protein PUR61_38550 [Streptomyces sp. BE20]|uniref:hypothetical protein n=1 Tax=Streptomyces sp. BE20 TaxID=3002525 RepID=UPI002E7A6783|nr:hypothetical protein [Streptomyces sp. BE20]MEE1828037.1 hypothetical protein [Streptomyces sp. BE20]
MSPSAHARLATPSGSRHQKESQAVDRAPQHALTSVYTDPFLGDTDGPTLLTADPVAAAHFFLDTDRLGHLEAMANATGHDATTLVPIRPGDIVRRALADLPAGEEDRQLLVANWRILNSSWPAREEPAALAAATWYLERLADLAPLTAQPLADLTGDQRARWQRDAIALQRDLLVLHPHLHPARIEAFTTHVCTELADRTPGDTTPTEKASADRWRLDTALDGALDLLPLDGEVRERVRAAAAEVLGSPRPLPLPGRLSGDADAALHWRQRVPSAQWAAEDTDATLAQAYHHVAQILREACEGHWSLAGQASTAPARTLAAETTGRHTVLGRLLALAEAERAATAHEPHLHDVAGAAARAARTRTQTSRLRAMEVHFAEQVAYTATFDAARSLLDDALGEQRAAVRATIAAYYPRPGHRLADQLAAGIDTQAVARAQNAVVVLGRELDDILARDRNPATRLRPSVEQITQAHSRSDAARRRFNDIVSKDRPATVAALRALRAVMDLPAPPEPGDGADRLTSCIDPQDC